MVDSYRLAALCRNEGSEIRRKGAQGEMSSSRSVDPWTYYRLWKKHVGRPNKKTEDAVYRWVNLHKSVLRNVPIEDLEWSLRKHRRSDEIKSPEIVIREAQALGDRRVASATSSPRTAARRGCVHGLQPWKCSACGPNILVFVYESSSSEMWHCSQVCPELLDGEQVKDAESQPRPKVRPKKRSALPEDGTFCQACLKNEDESRSSALDRTAWTKRLSERESRRPDHWWSGGE